MHGTIRTAICILWLSLPALAGPGVSPASAHERLLRCASASLSARPGHRPQHYAPRRAYAPVRSAMFFSTPDMRCRWKAPARRRG